MFSAFYLRFWILFRYTYNVLLVFLASFKIGRDAIDFLGIDELRLLLQTYMAKLIVRAVVTLVLYPVLCSTGYDLTWKHCLVLVWVNFKGAIALSFNLVRFRPNLSVDFALTEEAVRLGLVFLLQAINTTTLPWLMRNLGLVEMSEADKTNIDMVVEALHTKARTSTSTQRREKNYSGADWKWVQMHTYIENPYDRAVPVQVRVLSVPSFVIEKDLVQRFAGTEVIEKRSSRRISTRILEDTDTTHLGMDMDMLSSSLTQGWFHVLVGSVSIGFMLLLSGLAVYSNYRMTDVVLSLVVTSQGIYVLLFAMEILIVVYTTGTFALSRDAWQHMDVVLFFLVVAEFVLISLVTPSLTEKVYALYLQVSFIVLLLIRSFKALQKRAVLFVWLWDLLDSVLNHKLFYAYDLSCAYITAEDEAIDKVVRFVQSSNLATKIKGSCSKNKLQTLKNVMDIQQKYPNIEVATKTRQCARRCLNKALDALHELHDGGLLDDKQFTMLLEDMTWRIHAVDGMPTNISVGHPALSIMQSIPWLPRNVVQTLLEVRCFPVHSL
ncbi:conserved hypothetical protein [Ixodes scapularis]|uniref:Ion transport domain-containing protein n=1 Tax=Ixodes scapularis TaxID=6945 RepID=B7Q8C7_IXOSC|nr:conserved hypothetical protein [Ixodes scapularis]|eukprot:XP_002412342.1 conserved hypothetical protein [Ixodes scapularis]